MASLMQTALRKIGRKMQAESTLYLNGQTVPAVLKRNDRARRIILRMNKTQTGVTITVPPGVSFERAMEFAAQQATFIVRHLKKPETLVGFQPGAQVPVRGEMRTIIYLAKSRGTVFLDDEGGLQVAGDAPHISRRVTDFLKKQARSDLTAASRDYAEKMAVKFTRISLRDQQSRWGSCTEDGHLSYSWRLIMAPSFVLDYVAAHEVAHLQEMNHSARFWDLVAAHCSHMDEGRAWLKKYGRSLHKYGV